MRSVTRTAVVGEHLFEEHGLDMGGACDRHGRHHKFLQALEIPGAIEQFRLRKAARARFPGQEKQLKQGSRWPAPGANPTGKKSSPPGNRKRFFGSLELTYFSNKGGDSCQLEEKGGPITAVPASHLPLLQSPCKALAITRKGVATPNFTLPECRL